MDDIEAGMNLFDGDTFIDSIDDEYKRFMRPFLETQMFKMFIQERVTIERPDWFELALTQRTKQRANAITYHGARHIDGMLYKMGTQFTTWHMRHFEIRKNSNILRWYLPDPKLDELDRRYNELRHAMRTAPNDNLLIAQLRVVSADRERLRLDKERGTITLLQGLTEVLIPDAPRKYQTPFAFEVIVLKDPRDTKLNPSGDRGIDHRLLCCAPTSDIRLQWIQVIRARTAKATVIRSFSGFYQPPESKLQQRLRLARMKQWETQARMLRPHAALSSSAAPTSSFNTTVASLVSPSSGTSSLVPPASSSSGRRPSIPRMSSSKGAVTSPPTNKSTGIHALDEEKCLFICMLTLVSITPTPFIHLFIPLLIDFWVV